MPGPCKLKRGERFVPAVSVERAAGHDDAAEVVDLISAGAAEPGCSAIDRQHILADRMHVVRRSAARLGQDDRAAVDRHRETVVVGRAAQCERIVSDLGQHLITAIDAPAERDIAGAADGEWPVGVTVPAKLAGLALLLIRAPLPPTPLPEMAKAFAPIACPPRSRVAPLRTLTR